MADIEIKVTGKALQWFRREGPLKKAVTRAAKKGASTSARDMKSEAKKVVKERKTLPPKKIDKALSLRPSRGRRIDAMQWGVRITPRLTRISDFKFGKQLTKGVKVEINKGEKKLFEGAFVATLKSGHKGVFRRDGKRRLPINEPMTSMVIDVLRGKEEQARIQERGRTAFEKTFDRVLPLEVAKL